MCFKWFHEKRTGKTVLCSAKAERLLRKAVKSGDRELLFRIYRETDDKKIRLAVYEELIRPEKQVSFGGMDWIILDQAGDRQLLLSKYALDGFEFGRNTFQQKNYIGDGQYYTINCSWELSLIRRYLNTELISAFSADDRNRIVRVDTDPVFVLSLDEYMKYAKSSVAVRAAFSEDGTEAICWSRSSAGHEVHNAVYKTSYYVFENRTDLESVPSSEWGYANYGFDHVLSIRPALWVRIS